MDTIKKLEPWKKTSSLSKTLVPILSLKIVFTSSCSSAGLRLNSQILWKRSNDDDRKPNPSASNTNLRQSSALQPLNSSTFVSNLQAQSQTDANKENFNNKLNPTPMPTSFTNSTLNNENRQNSTTSHHNSGIYVAIFIAAMIALIFFVLYFIHWKYKSILTLVENQLCKGEDSYNKPFKREKFKRSPTSSTISKTSASSKKSSSSFSSPIYNGEIYSHHNRRLSGSKQKFFEDSAAAPSTSSPLRSSSDSKSSFNWPKETAHNYSSNSFEEYSQTFLSSANARNTDNRRSVNSEKDNVIQVTLNGEESRGIEGFDTRYSINYEENDDTKNLKNNLKKIITRPKDYHKNYETVERSVSYVNLHRRSQSSPNILFNKNYKNYQNHSTTMVMTEEKEEDFYYFNNRNKNPNCLSVSEEFVGADQLDNQNISRCPSISPTPPGYLRSPIDTISFKDQQGKQTNIREQNRQKDNNSEETKNETKVEENGRFGQHRPSYLGRGDSYFWKTSPRS